MAELTNVLFSSFGLPVPKIGKKISANLAALTKRVDGNTDTNLDGKVDRNDKNGYVEPEELYEEIFSNRDLYPNTLKMLRSKGLEDPFELTPEIKTFITRLFASQHPKTSFEKAIAIFRAVIPTNKHFAINGKRYYGLAKSNGGLEIPYNPNFKAALRIKYGDLLPKEIMATPAGQRIAHCVEYSHLLVSLLRAAGIDSQEKQIPNHVYVIAKIDGVIYRLDAGRKSDKLIFAKTNESGNIDRDRIAAHYLNEADLQVGQGKIDAAKILIGTALELKPDSDYGWGFLGILMAQEGKLNEAVGYLDRSIKINPNEPMAWTIKYKTHYKLGDFYSAALSYCKRFELIFSQEGLFAAIKTL